MRLSRVTVVIAILAAGPLLAYAVISACSIGLSILCGHSAPLSFALGTFFVWLVLAVGAVMWRSRTKKH